MPGRPGPPPNARNSGAGNGHYKYIQAAARRSGGNVQPGAAGGAPIAPGAGGIWPRGGHKRGQPAPAHHSIAAAGLGPWGAQKQIPPGSPLHGPKAPGGKVCTHQRYTPCAGTRPTRLPGGPYAPAGAGSVALPHLRGRIYQARRGQGKNGKAGPLQTSVSVGKADPAMKRSSPGHSGAGAGAAPRGAPAPKPPAAAAAGAGNVHAAGGPEAWAEKLKAPLAERRATMQPPLARVCKHPQMMWMVNAPGKVQDA